MPGAPHKALLLIGAALVLAACNTTDRVGDSRPAAVRALASVPPPPETTGSIDTSKKNDPEPQAEAKAAERAPEPAKPVIVLPGDEPEVGQARPSTPKGHIQTGNAAEAIAEGRNQYRANHFREAESHFRRATEIDPRSTDAWLGIAASADRLRNFKMADTAYAKARAAGGSTSEVLNNQGYSYILRGDLKRARDTLMAAQKLDPRNKYVENNLTLLDASERQAKR